MKSRNYKYILAFISITILATIGLQIYWNVKNYAENERRLVNDVQVAFDKSIEHYYEEDAKNTFMSFVENSLPNLQNDTVFQREFKAKHFPVKSKDIRSIAVFKNENGKVPSETNSIKVKTKAFAKTFMMNDSLQRHPELSNTSKFNPSNVSNVKIVRGKRAVDSLSKAERIANKIIVSMFQDSIELNRVATAFNKELSRKSIEVDYRMQHLENDSVIQNYSLKSGSFPFKTFGTSGFLPPDQKLKLEFSNPTLLILKRSMTEILLSLFLSLSIIFCLLYLLKTINRQKKIDEMKNDLISNITHEFKTPITTVSTALEGIKSFNAMDDKEKTTRYIDISNQQLKKLEVMVEKLLETASLETDKIILNKEMTDLVDLIRSNIEKHQMNSIAQHFSFATDFEEFNLKVDAFHLENAISNILDNAVKYGGTSVEIFLKAEKDHVLISIEDNGKGIEKREREKIFEKFYRIQKGNIHDVKGFGIGLYYSKKIIEKHNGTIELVVNSKTIFKITLPNE